MPLERSLAAAGPEWETAANEVNALEEEMDGVTLQRAEFVVHREAMEVLYDDLKRKYGRDISDFISSAESKHAPSSKTAKTYSLTR